jgi:hypothetical protein
VNRSTKVIAACLSLVPGPALAWDWSLYSTLSETVELNNNQFMNTVPTGGTVGSYTTLSASALGLTSTSKLMLDGDIGYRKYWGPGTEGVSQTESDSAGLKAHYESWGKNLDDKYWLDGTFRQSSTLVAVLEDLGVTANVHGDLDRTMVGGGIQRSLSALDTISVSATSALTTYTPSSGGTEFTDTSVVTTWRHRVSPLTTLSATSQVEWLNYETSPFTNLYILRETAGFETRVSPLLSYGGSAGIAYTDTQIGNGSPFGPTVIPPTPLTGGSTVGFIGDAHALYKILKNTTLNLTAGETVAPSIVGTLTQRIYLHAGLIQTINDRSSVSLAGEASRQTSSGTTNDFLSASVSYSYILARDLNASLTYRYIHRTATTGGTALDPVTGLPTSFQGPADSNSIMVVVSKKATIIPQIE